MMRLVASEAQEQIALMKWACLTKLSGMSIGTYLFHIPNQGKRSKMGGHQLVRMGLKAGVPDLFLAYPKWHTYLLGYPGMFIEMKRRNLKNTPDGGLMPEQKDMLNLLDSVGYKCIVAYGWEEARDAILEYLSV
jgi:VRR-NUC domain-containing protein